MKEVRRRTEKRCRMTREMLNTLCAIYMDCLGLCCDNCDVWYHTTCTDANHDNLPDIFFRFIFM